MRNSNGGMTRSWCSKIMVHNFEAKNMSLQAIYCLLHMADLKLLMTFKFQDPQ